MVATLIFSLPYAFSVAEASLAQTTDSPIWARLRLATFPQRIERLGAALAGACDEESRPGTGLGDCANIEGQPADRRRVLILDRGGRNADQPFHLGELSFEIGGLFHHAERGARYGGAGKRELDRHPVYAALERLHRAARAIDRRLIGVGSKTSNKGVKNLFSHVVPFVSVPFRPACVPAYT